MAVGLRLYGIAESFHIDDFQVFAKARLPLSELMPRLLEDSYLEPPLSYLPVKVAMLFGDSEWLLRLPSIGSSVFAVLLVYLLGGRLFSRPVGLIAAALLAVAPADIRYAQDLRFWSQLSAVHLASLLLLIYALQKDGRQYWAAYACVALVGIYFNVIMLGLVLLQGVMGLALIHIRWEGIPHSLRKSPRRLTRNLLASQALVFVSFLPWLIAVAIHWLGNDTLRLGRGYDLTPDPGFLHETGKWLLTNTSSESLLAWLLYGVIAFGAIAGARRGTATVVLFGYVLIALGGIAVLSDRLGTYLATRRILFLLPLLLLLAAYGISELCELIVERLSAQRLYPSRTVRVAMAAVGVVVLAGISVPGILAFYDSERTNFRAAGEFLRENVEEDDLIVLAPRFPEFLEAERYYMGDDLQQRSMTLAEFSRLIPADDRLDHPLRVWWVANFPPPPDRYAVFAFNDPNLLQRIAGARALSHFDITVLVAHEDLFPPISHRAFKLSALAMATAQANTPYPILPGERGMADRLESDLAIGSSGSATYRIPP
jgi:hypothetical protein